MTPLVLVHGFLGGSAQWDGLIAALAPERTVIALDLPGFGAQADLAPLDRIESYAVWVVDTLRDRGIVRYHLLGHSMGGMIAQEVARIDATRVARLILYGTGPQGALPGRFETIAQSQRRARQDGPHATARRIAATWLRGGAVSPLYPDVAHLAEQAGAQAIAAGLDAMQHWSGLDHLKEIEAETLIIWGDRDRSYEWSQIENLWSGLATAQLCVLPDCAHLAHLEHAAVFAAVTRRFLATVP